MDKSLNTDIQILLNILKIQNDMLQINDKYDEIRELAANKQDTELMQLYMLKIIALTKNITSKTKKEVLTFLDTDINKTILKDLEQCYPTISNEAMMLYASRICNETSLIEIKEVVKMLIEKAKGSIR